MTGDLSVLEALEAMQSTAPGPSRHGQPDTAHAAARANAPRSPGQRARVLAALADAGEAGLTDYEASIAANIVRPHVAGTRRAELQRAGLVAATERTRPTDTGSPAVIWCVTPAGVAAARAMREGLA